MGYTIKSLISEEELDRRIREVAEEINKNFRGESLKLVGVLKGSVYFMVKLSHYLTMPVMLDFMSVSSYGSGTVSSGNVILKKDLDESIENCDVLICEDIVDSGRSLHLLKKLLLERNPKSLKVCTLLDKPSRRVIMDMQPDLCCFRVPDLFVVGCGLDYDQKYRNLPYIGYIEFDETPEV